MIRRSEGNVKVHSGKSILYVGKRNEGVCKVVVEIEVPWNQVWEEGGGKHGLEELSGREGGWRAAGPPRCS